MMLCLGGRTSISTLAALWLAVAACGAQQQPTAADLSFWVVGSSGSAERFGSDLYATLRRDKPAIDEVLVAIAEQPLTKVQILAKTGLPRTRVADVLSRLQAVHVVTKCGEDQWATTLPVMTDGQMMALTRSLAPIARAVARQIRGALPRLKEQYARAKSPEDPRWESVAHLFIDKFIIDGAFHADIVRGEHQNGARRYYSQEQEIIPAFMWARGEHFSTFGTNWYGYTQGEAERAVYVLHGSTLGRYRIRMNGHRGDSLLSAALFALAPDGAMDSLSESQKATLRGLGWTEGGSLLVPVIQGTTIKALLPALDEVAQDAANVVLDNYSIMLDAFHASPYSRFLDAGGDYLQVCYHTLFGMSIGRMIQEGVLPPVPNPLPEYAAVYITIGRVY